MRFLVLLAIGARVLSGAPALVFTDVSIVDVKTGRIEQRMTVVVEGDRIKATGKAGRIAIPRGSRVVPVSGKYMIPGLWDAHTHALRRERIDRWLPLFIANGVTGIRDMGSPLSMPAIRQLDRECQSGQRIGPRIVANGRIFGGAFPDLQARSDSIEEARASVRELTGDGADFIKVSSFLSRDLFFAVAAEARRLGLPVTGHVPESLPIVEAVQAGMKSFEHLFGLLQACSADREETAREIQEAIAGKKGAEATGALVRTTDRLYGKQARERTYSERNCLETAAALARAGAWQCPTLVVRLGFVKMVDPERHADSRLEYMDDTARSSWPALSRTYAGAPPMDNAALQDRKIRLEQEGRTAMFLAAHGVPVLAGTDVGNPWVFPGFSVHEEMALLVKAGSSPLAALQAATLNPARFFGRDADLGSVERGKLADLVLLSANPLISIGNSERIWAVVANGRFFDGNALSGLLDGARSAR